MEGEAETRDDAKVINYLTAEGFEDLNVKLYSVRELENLLGSTEIHQRLFALDLLSEGLLRNEKIADSDLFGTVLNPDVTKVIARLQ